MKLLLEIAKWIYGLVMGSMLFLFFCLVLDAVCYWIGSGWNPLLGSWPIFAGTVGAVLYNDVATVVLLVAGLAVIGRLIIWDRVPPIVAMWMKHPE